MKRPYYTLFIILAFGMSAELACAQERLPQAAPPFKGKIGDTFKDSTPDYPQPVKAPAGSPNVLIILLDDVGFGKPTTISKE